MQVQGGAGRGGGGGGLGHTFFSNRQRPQRSSWAILRRVAGVFRPYRLAVAALLVTVTASAVIGLAPPLLIARIVDNIGGAGGGPPRARALDLDALLIFVSVIVAALLSVLQSYLNNGVGQGVMYDMRNRLYRHLQAMSLRFFTSTRSGEILSRLNNDVGGVQDAVTTSFTNVISNLIVVITTVAAMVVLDWWLTLIAVLPLPLFIIPTRVVGARQRALLARTQERLGDMNAQLQETLSVNGALLTKIFGRQAYEYGRFDETNRDVRTLTFSRLMTGRWFFMFLGLFGSVAPALVYWYGGHEVISGNISAGEVVGFALLIGRIFSPVTQLLSVWVTVQSSLALFERVFDYGDLPREIDDAADATPLEHVAGRVTYDHVSFSYTKEIPALTDVSLEIAPGRVAALVGPSGAGKTTLTYLLPRLYDVNAGRVMIDGRDIRSVTLDSLSQAIGVVTQEPYLFHATIRDNIRYARPDASDDDVRRAAHAAYIDEFVDGLPYGYETIVGERGYRLSGGEKQRVAIARAVLKDPPILILDEATSSLDSHSERIIQLALEDLSRGRTTLIIAHRLSTVLAADVIFVVDGGHIVEQGKHAELLALGGLYASLYHQQFGPGRARREDANAGAAEVADGGGAPVDEEARWSVRAPLVEAEELAE
ncbi:MAG: ABC transporter ATP-binding protein [Dehalococcoidia bacterium]|nr:ABC transporter ATP-binding protein [Dehalococcoidia bacterium]